MRRCDGGGRVRRPGDAGFSEFYQRSYARIVTLVAVLLGDQHEAQDVTQEAFAQALGRWPRLRTQTFQRPGSARWPSGSPLTSVAGPGGSDSCRLGSLALARLLTLCRLATGWSIPTWPRQLK